MKYSIVIPTYNHCDDLLKPCIESIIQYSIMPEVELIISANGCTDNTRNYLDKLKIQFNDLGFNNHLKIVWNEAPLGYAKATNEGIKVASADKIILFNNDAFLLGQVPNTWLDLLVAPFLKNPKCGITYVIESISPSAGGVFPIFFCVMIDRKVFDTIGLLNEAYGVGGGEDTEFTIEAKAAGFDSCIALDIDFSSDVGTYVGHFPIYHKGEGTMHDTTLVPDHSKVIYDNSVRLAKKYNPSWLIDNAPEHVMPKVKYSIIIPTYNHCDDLLKPCIDSIIAYTDLSQAEVIIVANGCTDSTYEYVMTLTQRYNVEDTHNPFKLIWINEAIGYTCATNLGINAAQGEYIVLLNNDTEVLTSAKDKWLTILQAPFSDETVAISGPLQLYDQDVQSNFIVFFCAMIPRRIFNSIGILDEIFNPGYGEDIDFSVRAINAGYKISVIGKTFNQGQTVDSMPIWHKNNKTFSEIDQYSSIIERNKTILKDRYSDTPMHTNAGCELENIVLDARQIEESNTTNLKLNLACGLDYRDGYVNADLYPLPNAKVDAVFDVSSIPYADNTVDEIIASHIIEHFDVYESRKILQEWHRVLKPGGKLIVETPDFLASCDACVKASNETRWSMGGHFFATPWIPGQTHKFLFTEQWLCEYLIREGFSSVTRVPPISKYATAETAQLFLNMEAIK